MLLRRKPPIDRAHANPGPASNLVHPDIQPMLGEATSSGPKDTFTILGRIAPQSLRGFCLRAHRSVDNVSTSDGGNFSMKMVALIVLMFMFGLGQEEGSN